MISFATLELSRVIFSKAWRAGYTVICINSAFTRMIDNRKTQNPSKFEKGTARYNEFHCKSMWHHLWIESTAVEVKMYK